MIRIKHILFIGDMFGDNSFSTFTGKLNEFSMITQKWLCIICLVGLFSYSKAADFTLVSKTTKVSIVYAKNESKLDSITASLLAFDIQRVTGYLPFVSNDISKVKGSVIIIGSLQSKLVQDLLGQQSKEYINLKGKWESYLIKMIDKPLSNITSALLIAGSDKRGTAYGVFHISEVIGVSPWYWWADVPTVIKKDLTIQNVDYVSKPPSVKYRGIFLNDEDWGLQPWAAKTFEPETGDIGPKTYAKIFELLLRLNANLIWPAMHPSTKAFYHYPDNKKVADDYGIVIGSSHAEPMLRNNVGEWDEKTMGTFNYVTNKTAVQKYWEDRVKESSSNEVIYTMGMRGVHDSGIEGVKTIAETVPLLEQIFADQRDMLRKYVNKNVTAIPQAFTAYKEVLDIYDNNLKVPDDITIVWPDDNYGYIQRLDDQNEQARAGGSGVYYHGEYWGRPHDYTWLSSTNPALIREEMMKAFEMKTDKIWVLNVGDLKPIEYNMQLFLDMAYNVEPFKKSEYVKAHMFNWTAGIFGAQKAKSINDIMLEYYELAFERRPEFMGWSQTEPTTKTNYTEYNHFYYGDEAQQRIYKFNAMESKVMNLRKGMDASIADAFYELIYYPVVCASLISKKFIYRDKSYLYGMQNRMVAFDYAAMSKKAYDSIRIETSFYNNQLANGKWKGMMVMDPRNLPVYQEPGIPKIVIDTTAIWGVITEGFGYKDSTTMSAGIRKLSFPSFNSLTKRKYFIDIFLSNSDRVYWTSTVSDKWIKLSQDKGVLENAGGKKQCRIWVSIDWPNIPTKEKITGYIGITDSSKQKYVNAFKYLIDINVINPGITYLKDFKGAIEDNGIVSIFASNFNKNIPKGTSGWTIQEDLGHTGNSLEALPLSIKPTLDLKDPEVIKKQSPFVQYDFYSLSSATPEVTVYTLPTHELNKNWGVRFAASIDDGPLQIIDFKTVGRSEIWKQNVLRNSANSKFKSQPIEKGKHNLKIYMMDPGVILDRIIINLGGLEKSYGVIPETRISEIK